LKKVISAIAIALLTVIAMPVLKSVAAGSADGSYRLEIKYSKFSSADPRCEGYLFPEPMIVSDGKVTGTLRHNRRGLVFLNGTVATDGILTATGQGNSVEGEITGKLTKDGGSGTWKETHVLFCDGTWTAKPE
jgi:hypothetical protein